MPEGQSLYEQEFRRPLSEQVQAVFERRATKGERKLIMETYKAKLATLIQTMPKEDQGNVAISLQKLLVNVGAFFQEYGARFTDYMRNIVFWPMIRATKDFPKDKYYQLALAKAKAWGEFGMDTRRTATAERMAYRDHFVATAASYAGVLGTAMGGGAVLAGAVEGAKVGAVVGMGIQGAAVGAVAGGILGGAVSAGLYFKDKIMGPPVVFYDLFTEMRKGQAYARVTEDLLPSPPVGNRAI